MPADKSQKKRAVKPKVSYPPPPEEPTTYEDGWTVHPQFVMYRKAKGGKASQKVAGFDLVSIYYIDWMNLC